jgi:ParB-like chromosome segregation protein Spo0J
MIAITNPTLTPINQLTPHPDNARHGNVDLIAQSLAKHGQYQPVVINQDNTILAGHHVVKAARKLGWTTIATVQINTTDQQARRILLADNRTADLATYNEPALLEILDTLPNLDDTGFGKADLTELNNIINGTQTEPDLPPPPNQETLNPTTPLRLGPQFTAEISTEHYETWLDAQGYRTTKKHAVITELKNRLGLPHTTPKPTPPANIHQTTETIPIHTLTANNNNPRQGDIGTITESLQTNGQYRPITVNRRTGHIIKGNHTYLAAKQLAWTHIAVHWIDVDEEEETRILLIDNRTADLATYNTDALKTLLTSIHDYQGTGYTIEDVNDILNGGPGKPGPKPTGQTSMRIGQHSWKTPTDDYNRWAETQTLDSIATRLAITLIR